MAEQLREASLRDPLTGLHNRRFLVESITPDLACSRRMHEGMRTNTLREGVNTDVGFLMIDVDHFKRVNDTYGHQAGDRILVEFAERVWTVLRETDSLLRWGGEEFLVVLRRTEPAGLAIVAERIRAIVENTRFILPGETRVDVTCSVGFSRYPVDGDDSCGWEGVVQMADKALYLAKERGRNTWVGVEIIESAVEQDKILEVLDDLVLAERSGMVQLITRDNPSAES